MNGMDMSLVRRRLRQFLGANVAQFSYHPVTEGIAENTLRLSRFIDRQQAATVHLVGHSLGGVLALKTLRCFPTDKIGRVVCLGSPLLDSSAARTFSRWTLGRKMIGQTLREAVLEDPLQKTDEHPDVGVIAGTIGLGLGLLVGRLDKPHDGVVTEQETKLPGITDHLVLPVNHFGMLVSKEVAAQTASFLRDGKFQH
jgi:hypothetical protein